MRQRPAVRRALRQLRRLSTTTAPRRTPLWRLLAVVAGALALLPATGPVKDFDVYWHVRLGDHILRTQSLPTRELWDFPAVGRPWVAHSWLSEVLLALAHRAGGWGGVVALRLVLGAVLLALVARAAVRGTDAVVGPLVFALCAVLLTGSILERPQLFATVLLAALLPLVDRARAGTAPHPLAAFGLGWLWASLHGSWPLLPLLLLLAAAGVVVDRRPGAWPAVRRLAVAAAAAVAGSALTPAGPPLLLRPFVVGRAAHALAEWRPVRPWTPLGAAFVLLVVALVAGWVRSRDVPRSEVLWCAVLVVGAMAAIRNGSFATVLLCPVVARRVSSVVPPGRRSQVSLTTVRAFGAVAAVLLVALTAVNPRLPTDAPLRMLAVLRAQPGQVRLLNDYNLGGLVTGLGGPNVSAAVDGRVDAFPPGYLDRYLAAMSLDGDWEALLAELRPTHALLRRSVALVPALEQRGWRLLDDDGFHVLLAAP